MIIKPMIRSNMCTNAHPIGCAKETENQINKIKRNIELLKQNNVRVSVHTVVTKINYDSIIEIGRYLRKYKIAF